MVLAQLGTSSAGEVEQLCGEEEGSAQMQALGWHWVPVKGTEGSTRDQGQVEHSTGPPKPRSGRAVLAQQVQGKGGLETQVDSFP